MFQISSCVISCEFDFDLVTLDNFQIGSLMFTFAVF